MLWFRDKPRNWRIVTNDGAIVTLLGNCRRVHADTVVDQLSSQRGENLKLKRAR